MTCRAVDRWLGVRACGTSVSIKRWGPGNWVLARRGARVPAVQFKSLRAAVAYAGRA